MTAFVLALTKLTLTHGVAESSRTAIGRTLVSKVPCSRDTLAWAVIVGLIPRRGRNKGTLSWVTLTSTNGPRFPSSSSDEHTVLGLPMVKLWAALVEPLCQKFCELMRK